MKARVVAIDGPAASGKSSTARAVARRLGAYHLDSGALYRSLTRVALDLGSDDAEAVLDEAARRGLELRVEGREITPYLDGRPAESEIRSAPVTAAVSALAALSPVREWVNERLRAAARPDRLLVLDGRDIGTAVFPEAALKVFLTASPESRATRRLRQRGDRVTAEALTSETEAIRARDARDSSRAVAPLECAPDATLLDTTDLSFEDQVSRIVALAQARFGSEPGRVARRHPSG